MNRIVFDGDVDIEHCPPGQPSAALRQAVADADRHARQLLPVPLYALRWCRVPRSMRCSHNGATQHRPPSMPVVWLRDDLQPDQAYRTMLHAKTCTIDGQWSTIGTANLDRLSSVGNYEINAEIYSEALARQMEDLFTNDTRNAFTLTYDQWMRRPWYGKLGERIVSPLRVFL